MAIVVIFVFATGKPDESGLTLGAIQPQDQAGSWNNNLGLFNLQYGPATSYPLILAFFFSLLLANWTYTGYDASAHVAEETVGARMASAWGVFLSVAVSAVVGYIFLVALTTHLPSLTTLFPPTLDDDDSRPSSQYYFGSGVAVIDDPATTTSARSGTSSPPASRSRCGSAAWRRSPPPAGCCSRSAAMTGSPGRAGSSASAAATGPRRTALTAVAVVAWLFTVAAFIVGTGTAIIIVTAISTIFLYAAYGLVHLPRRRRRRMAGRIGSGALDAGPSRWPTSPSSGSSS